LQRAELSKQYPYMSCKYIPALLTLLLFGAAVAAQELPDAPSVAVGSFPAAASMNVASSSSASTSGALPAAKKPWIDPTVADAPYWGATFALVSTTIVNVEMTARCSEQHLCLTYFASGASRLDLYAYTLPVDAAVSYLTYKMKKKNRLWILPDALISAANLFSAGRSYDRLEIGPLSPQKSALSPGRNRIH
jgi:hypothetical protein